MNNLVNNRESAVLRSADIIIEPQIVDFSDQVSLLAHDMRVYDKFSEKLLGIPYAQLSVLRVISHSRTVTAAYIASYSRIRPQSVAAMLYHLESAGLIERSIDTGDRRALQITLTDKGKAVIDKDRILKAQWLYRSIENSCSPVEIKVLLLAGEIIAKLHESLACDQ